jgi:hypothetical protein
MSRLTVSVSLSVTVNDALYWFGTSASAALVPQLRP